MDSLAKQIADHLRETMLEPSFKTDTRELLELLKKRNTPHAV